ncbi:hypothetical protein ABBQ38_014358 [Trebouxia sp. C0009 RCD-2024]
MKEPGPRDRRPLFGSASSYGQATASTSAVDPESLERENDQSIDNLGQRTSLLRQVTAGIKDEVEKSHKALDAIAGDMGSARMGLGATVHRFKKVFEEPQKKQLLYWVVAIVAVLFVLYNLIKFSRR